MQAALTVLLSISANIGSFFFGITLVWSSIIGPQIVENEKYKFWITKTQFGVVVSAMSLGAACSCIVSGMVRHSVGTRYTIFIFSMSATIGSVLITVPQNLLMVRTAAAAAVAAIKLVNFEILTKLFLQLAAGRFLIGITIGSYSFLIPIYTGEISSRKHRGTMLSFFQIMLNLGILFPYVLGYFVSVITFNIVCGSIPLFYSIAFLALPESPVYLVSKGRDRETQDAMLLLRGKESDYRSEVAAMQEEQTKVEKLSFKELMRVKSVRKASMIIMFQFFCFQLSGANAVTFYAQQIFIDAAMKIESSLATIIVAIFQFITSLIAVKLINSYGRKTMICTFNVFVAASLVALGSYFTLKDHNHPSTAAISWLPLLSLCVYLVTFCLGMGPVSELRAISVRYALITTATMFLS
jgi:MFS family permease